MSSMLEQLAPEYNRLTFADVFTSKNDFREKLRDTTIITAAEITDAFLERLYFLLYANHGNDCISMSDETQWIFNVALITEANAPTYLKKEEVQKKLRSLSDDDLREGYKSIFNHANNPSTKPSTDASDEIPYISDQSVTKAKKNKTAAYIELWESLRTDLLQDFLRKYNKIFSRLASTSDRMVYIYDN